MSARGEGASFACDSHVHIEPVIAPEPAPHAITIGDTTFPALQQMHRTAGIKRAVVVQRFTAGTNTHVLETVLAYDPANVRGVTVLDDTVSDRDLEKLHAAGVRGVRVNLGATHLPRLITPAEFERVCSRIEPFGWHVKMLIEGEHLAELAPALQRVRIPAVLDHCGLIDPAGGVQQPAFKLVEGLLRSDNWWVLLAAANRASHEAAPWRDMVPMMSALAAAAPDRALWGTDWPHSHHAEPLPEADDLIALLETAVPDPVARRRILVDNPARLYDF